MDLVTNKFTVFTTANIDTKETYVKWNKGLRMTIIKNDVTIVLNEDEIQELMASIPKSIGGKYN